MPDEAPDKADQQMVIMLRQNMDSIPRINLPDGFSSRGMTRDDVRNWTEIWRSLEPSGRIGDDLFFNEFGKDWDEIGRRCFLIEDTAGSCVGTISAWYDSSFKGGEWGRIHWVAVRKEFQGRGLAKPMLSLAMEKLASRHCRCYLVTHAHRIPAISLYLKFGFVPDLSSEKFRKLWIGVLEKLQDPSLKSQLEETIGLSQNN